MAPVRTLTHRATGKTVTLIGVIHAGHASYYQTIREIIDDTRARGAAIHGEGCMHRQPGPETAMTPDERAAVEAMGRNGKLGRRNALTTNDHLTLVWGGRHHSAFVRALRRRGYRTSHLTWLTVGTLPGTSDPRPAPASAA